MSEPTLSVTIIGINEADHLRRLAKELTIVDDVVYVDCESTDDSVEVATKAGWRVFHKKNDPNININRQFAMDQGTSDWVFYLDPDEEIPLELFKEIKARAGKEQYVAYQLPRKNFYFGRWLKYGSQYPDTQLRVLKKGKARFPGFHVHEKLNVDGPVGKLKADMIHYPYLDVSQYLKKFDFYTTFEAKFMYERGVRPSLGKAFKFSLYKPITRIFRRYVLKGGFLDGWQGLFASFFDGANFYVRYAKLCEIAQKGEKK